MKLLEALIDLNPDGSNHYKRGDIFEMSDSSAAFLIKLGKAKLAAEDAKEPKRRQYLRRDLRAQD